MDIEVEQALATTLSNWKRMSQVNEEEESIANAFEASFYLFIDCVREWFSTLTQQPQTLEAFLALPMIEAIVEQLPPALHLNFETEAELIIEHKYQINDAKYD